MAESVVDSCVGAAIVYDGCDALEYDANQIAKEVFTVRGLIKKSVHEADIVILLGCTFTQQKENEFKAWITKMEGLKNSKKLIVTGCYLEETGSDSKTVFLRKEDIIPFLDSYVIQNKRSVQKVSQERGFGEGSKIAISEGCYGKCTFCSVKLVRGEHRSRTVDKIIQDIEAICETTKRIKLCGQDVAAYGVDLDINLWHLIRTIYDKFDHLEIGLGSLNPRWLDLASKEELRLLSDDRFVGNVHIPLESASDTVLAKMKRGYDFRTYSSVLDKVRGQGVRNISTDLMAGFPGETTQDHNKTLRFIESQPLEFAQVFAYEPRAGTPAANYEQIPRQIKIERTLELLAQYAVRYVTLKGISEHKLLTGDVKIPFNTNINIELEEI